MIDLFEKFKDKTICIKNIDADTIYIGTIISQEENFIEFQTDRDVFYFNINHISRIFVRK